MANSSVKPHGRATISVCAGKSQVPLLQPPKSNAQKSLVLALFQLTGQLALVVIDRCKGNERRCGEGVQLSTSETISEICLFLNWTAKISSASPANTY
ncbi:unnamed protein product [Litomosoides sigmodontis]|uniref:Uncharacterized protein n=1 Tax=Litomosoides sigmodontis TaxID=42156 RepID=A0A3P7JMV8_LITSI|nr:unnamed protein product [Litomosoides sigmodontis]